MYGDDDEQIKQLLAQMGSYAPDPRDRELQSRWRDEESQSLERLNGQGDYGVGQLLRDVLPSALGIGLDAATNKGQGISGIAQAGIAQAATNADRDQKRLLADREYALAQRKQREASLGGNAFDRAYKQLTALNERDRIGLANQNAGYRGEQVQQGARRTKLAEDAHSYLHNPDDPRTVQLREQLIANGVDPSIGNMTAAALRDRAKVTGHEVDHAFANIEAGDAAEKARRSTEASTDARIKTESKLAPVSAATKALESGAASAATTDARIRKEGELADVSAGTKAKEAAGSTAGRLGAEGDVAAESFVDPLAREVVDPERVDRIKRSPEASKEAQKRLRASAGLVDSIGEMVSIRAQEAQGLITPGRAKSRILTERSHLEGLFAQANDMATIQEGDRQSMAKFLGLPAEASALDIASLLTGGDIKLDQLKGVQDALVAADERTAREYGYGAYGTKRVEPMAPRASKAPSARARAQPAAAAEPTAPPAAAGGMVTIRLGGEERQVPADQARRLKAINPSLEVF